MKHIKTFESYNQYEKVDENLKTFIAGALLSLSSLLPNKADAWVGGGISGGHIISTTQHSTQHSTQDSINSQKINDDITDPVLKDIKKSIDDGIQSKEEIDSIVSKLKKYADENKHFGDIDKNVDKKIKSVLDDLSKIDVNGDRDKLKNELSKITTRLTEIKNSNLSIEGFMLIAIISLFIFTIIKFFSSQQRGDY